jgi:hypothetical protein
MHGHINVKSPNNISEWQMGFNSAFKRLKALRRKKGQNASPAKRMIITSVYF